MPSSSRLPEHLRREVVFPPPARQNTQSRQPASFPPTPSSLPRQSRNDQPVTKPRGTLARIRAHPIACSVLGLLVLMLVADIAGLAVYVLKVPKANEGPLVILSLVFVAGLVAIFGLIFRQCLILHHLFHPRIPGSESSLPTWLTGLPTYRDVLRHDGQRRSTDHEGWSGILPSYRDAGRDELLMKGTSRHSRGQSVERVEQPSITVVAPSTRQDRQAHNKQPSIDDFF